ncbi:protein DROOPING LEAF-like isoform X2 [Musa acuminata AAA Group]|uniref:protein DROOPING LEAF-like isoform X2 n=1 Tax=Musa acuminata AAA Group TaxID=214697 RepID=UPI0031CE2D2F
MSIQKKKSIFFSYMSLFSEQVSLYEFPVFSLFSSIWHLRTSTFKVGVPCKRMMDTITVKCGHCNHLSFLGPRPIVQSLTPTNHHLIGLQGPCTDCLRGQPSPPSSTTSIEQMIQSPQFVMKPPEKKHRMPSAYNRFMKEEIQRIKAAKPDIPHREAFSMAAKNWAKCDPRCSSTIVSPSDTNELAPVPDSERSSCSRMESSSVCKQLEKKD